MTFGDTYKNAVKCPSLLALRASKSGIYATVGWSVGVAPAKEREISGELLRLFQEFWRWAELDQKSKTTKQRYSGALHALGGWAVEKAAEDNAAIDAEQLLIEATSGGDGPLIYLDRKEWQKELDTVSRKLYKFLVSQC